MSLTMHKDSDAQNQDYGSEYKYSFIFVYSLESGGNLFSPNIGNL